MHILILRTINTQVFLLKAYWKLQLQLIMAKVNSIAAYGLVIIPPFELMTLSCPLSFKAQQLWGGGLNMVSQC